MATTFNLSDVPAVEAGDLAAAMRTLIENGRGLVLLNGASDADLELAREVLTDRHHANPPEALAAFVRLRHLFEVFGARRLKQMLLDNGHALIAPAIAVASELRLNGNRGFNPQSFLEALSSAVANDFIAIDARRSANEPSEQRLAA
jgi:hypothetical protein